MWSRDLVVASVAALALLGGAAAQGDLGACDPLVPEACFLPFPNNFWLARDPSTVTGYRVSLQRETMPLDRQGRDFDPSEWNTLDGFSSMPSILTYFAQKVDTTPLPPHWDIAQSLRADCQTLLVEYATGTRLPHFVELDYSNNNANGTQAFTMWADRRLDDATRYIVAMRGLVDVDGRPVQPSAAFAALRDGTPTSDPAIEGRRAVFAEIFAKLESIGVRRVDLQMAWDFSTASRESVTERMVAARDDANARVGEDGPAYTITSVDEDFSEYVIRRIKGMMNVPLYCSSPYPGCTLVLDEKGLPVYQGTYDVEFTVVIPRSLGSTGTSGPIIQYGHGLLGGQGEVTTTYLQQIANTYGYVFCATDWQGMAGPDTITIGLMMLTDLGKFKIIPDRSTQGMVNALMLMKLMKGRFARDPLVIFNGNSVIDTTRRFYYGNSQGGILGLNYMATSQDVTRGVLGVSGAPYAILLPRSVDFNIFYQMLRARYDSNLERIWIIGFLCMLWERAEPSGYLSAINTPLPNTPAKRVILQYGLGDAQVSWLGTYSKARSIDAVIFRNNVRELNETIFGIDEVAGPVTQGSVAVGFSFGAPPAPRTNTPPDGDFDTHEKPRRDARAIEQMDLFFKTGQIVDTCDGVGCKA